MDKRVKEWWSYWIKWKPLWLKYELIYLLGGVPKEHIGTVHYRNIENVIGNIKRQIESATNIETQ